MVALTMQAISVANSGRYRSVPCHERQAYMVSQPSWRGHHWCTRPNTQDV